MFGQKIGQKRGEPLHSRKSTTNCLRKEALMYKFMQIKKFAKVIFDTDKAAQKASKIMEGILQSQSPRISDVADQMAGNEAANYKMIQRFLKEEALQEVLRRLFNEEAEFVIGDPTEIERPGAKKTEYVGTLSDGQTKGFWMLTLATPLRGRALPCHFVIYSSATINKEATSRNLEHQRAIQGIKELIGSRTLIFDREFSYLGFLLKIHAEQIKYVIRLNQGSHPPKFYYDARGKRELKLRLAPGEEPKIYHQVYYQGVLLVNLVGVWEEGFKSPLWIITNLAPEEGLRIYKLRSKIEVCFRDLKNLLHMDKVMNKSRTYLEKFLALLLLTYAIALLIGEAIRDVRLANIEPDDVDLHQPPEIEKSSKWHSFSGLFLLLKRRRRLNARTLRQIVQTVYSVFLNLIFGENVQSFVPC